MRRFPLLTLALLVSTCLLGCPQTPGKLSIEPNATLAPPTTTVTPPAGPFNGEVTLTFTSDRPATIYVTTDGSDPRQGNATRTTGPSPLTVKLSKTSTVKYFASEHGRDEDLKEGQWLRAGGPVGTISGVIVVGTFAVNKAVGLFNNATLKKFDTPTEPTEIPFMFDMLASGPYRLSAISDRNGDGQLIPFLDFQSATTTITLDLKDPFKASAEGVRIYLGSSGTGLGTLRGVIALPKPPAFQNLQISVLSPDVLRGGGSFDPATLLQQLQGGYRIITNQTDMAYPYVITDLAPGSVVPVPSLLGFGGTGLAINLIANPLRPVTIVADEETEANFAFGSVGISGQVSLGPTAAPATGLALGVLAARAVSLTDGIQAVMMPIIFTRDPVTGGVRGNYSGSAFRDNTQVSMRVFTNANGANPLTDALAWVINPISGAPGQATVTTGSNTDVVQDITVP
jgi:hypothetical protein